MITVFHILFAVAVISFWLKSQNDAYRDAERRQDEAMKK
jgi:hypothetical protein